MSAAAERTPITAPPDGDRSTTAELGFL